MATLRWLLVVFLWAVLDLSGPILPIPAEVVEEAEEVAHRAQRRRGAKLDVRPTWTRGHELRDETARMSRLVAAATPRRGHDAVTPRKLPPAGPGPDSPVDDH